MRQNKASLTPENIAYLKGIERRLIALQQRTLPGMRQAYANKVGRELWREDVYVSAGGQQEYDYPPHIVHVLGQCQYR